MLPKPSLYLALLVVAASCAPLVPLSYMEGSNNSQLTQSIETDDATVWLRFLKAQNGYRVFDLEIENHSPSEMPIAPQLISFYASSKPFTRSQTGSDVHSISAANSSLAMNRHFAEDPSSVKEFYINKAKSQKTGAGIFVLLAIGFALYDAAEDSKAAGKETFTSRDAAKSFGRDVMVMSAVAATDIARSSAEQTAEEAYHLPYELFPECTINPGNSVRGKIFLSAESHRYVRIIIPLHNTDYVFDFKRSGVK